MTTHTVMTHVPTQSDEEWLSTPSILGTGVSLVKITDGTPVAHPVCLALDATLPRGQRRGLDRNDLRALSRVFGTLARGGA